ncbi:MAG: three-Cys-motif partner protein TcmP [Candidatus Acidiferrales bacterium]
MGKQLQFDEIGGWSELKLEILKKYAAAYSTILSAQTKASLFHVYIDAFAGAGKALSKTTRGFVPGSPLNALTVQPQFREFHLIDIASEKVEYLQDLIGPRKDVFIYLGDCNEILLKEVFPRVRYEQYRRGLCVLDPYGLHLDWNVLSTAGQMRSLDVFLNFPVQDMNRNVFWKQPEDVDEAQIRRMNLFWGDESWRKIVYETKRNLFGFPEKEPNEVIAEAFRRRLKEVARFEHVPEPLAMENSKGTILYYLFFASQNSTAAKIAHEIFVKYRKRGGTNVR